MVNGETLSILKLFLPCRRTLNILCCCYFLCQLLFKKLGVKGINCSKIKVNYDFLHFFEFRVAMYTSAIVLWEAKC